MCTPRVRVQQFTQEKLVAVVNIRGLASGCRCRILLLFFLFYLLPIFLKIESNASQSRNDRSYTFGFNDDKFVGIADET